MNPFLLSGWGVEILAANTRTCQELRVQDGHQNHQSGESYVFQPRQCPHDAIIVEGRTGHISLQALRWLSANNIPVFFMSYDGSIISTILPPVPVKPDVRVGQIQALNSGNSRSVG